jgi:hypothetical protein
MLCTASGFWMPHAGGLSPAPKSRADNIDAHAEFRGKPAALSDHYLVMVKPVRIYGGILG